MKRYPTERSKKSDEELRREARSLGLPVGRTLSRDQLLGLLEGADGDVEDERFERSDGAELSLTSHLSTVTMATLYAQQGLNREASDVCRAILERNPKDERARRLWERLSGTTEPRRKVEADDALHRIRAPRRGQFAKGSSANAVLPESYGGNTVVIYAQSPMVVFVFWEIEGDVDSRCRRRAGESSVRVLRLFSVWQGESKLMRHTVDRVIEGRRGELFVGECQQGATITSAIGWRGAEESFLPVCHSSAVTTPRHGMTDRRQPLWGRVSIEAPKRSTDGAVHRFLDRLRPILSMSPPREDRHQKHESGPRRDVSPNETRSRGHRASSSWPIESQ